MNRFITALPKTLIAAQPLFQTALPVTIASRQDGIADLAQAASRRHCDKAGEDPHDRAQPWRTPDDVEFVQTAKAQQCEHGAGAGYP